MRPRLTTRQNMQFRPPFYFRALNTVRGPDSQSFVLPDNRVLGFSEYGNPDGYPLMFFHGFPSSRLEASGLVGNKHGRNLRIIAPDRPGFGLSTFQEHRKIMDWPADVQALADHLEISRFAILGGSGGGPYALACAQLLPPKMLSAVGVLAGAPPIEAGKKDLSLMYRVMASLAQYGMLGMIVDTWVAVARVVANTPQGINAINGMLVKGQSEEEAQISIEDRREKLMRAVFEAYTQGSQATSQEALLLTDSWDIEFENVKYDKIQVWHGKDDANAPISMIRYMVDRLPYAVLREVEGTHYTMSEYLEEVLLQLVPESLSQRQST